MENPLQENDYIPEINGNSDVKVQVRVPKKIIHCSDGVVEEYSDDEIDSNNGTANNVDTKTLNWIPWFMHYAVRGGQKAVEYCDYVGEGLADLLGITTPKYQLELSEYERTEAAKKKLQEESAGWMTVNGENGVAMVTLQPTSTNASIEKPAAL